MTRKEVIVYSRKHVNNLKRRLEALSVDTKDAVNCRLPATREIKLAVIGESSTSLNNITEFFLKCIL